MFNVKGLSCNHLRRMAILTAEAGTFGHSSSNRLQLSLICEQDPIHATFCAVVIEDLRTEQDLTRLAETVRGLETGNPAKPALLLYNCVCFWQSGAGTAEISCGARANCIGHLCYGRCGQR